MSRSALSRTPQNPSLQRRRVTPIAPDPQPTFRVRQHEAIHQRSQASVNTHVRLSGGAFKPIYIPVYAVIHSQTFHLINPSAVDLRRDNLESDNVAQPAACAATFGRTIRRRLDVQHSHGRRQPTTQRR